MLNVGVNVLILQGKGFGLMGLWRRNNMKPGTIIRDFVAGIGLVPYVYPLQPLSWLPNKAGYKFRAVLKDGCKQVCVVQRCKETGLHYVRGVKYNLIKAWENL
jgi:hypothetical protein